MEKALPKLQAKYDKVIVREQDLLEKLKNLRNKKKQMAWRIHSYEINLPPSHTLKERIIRVMKKILLIAIAVTFLNGCAKFEPIIDTVGKSKFETFNASEKRNDKILHVRNLKNNTTFFGNINFWILSHKKLKLNILIFIENALPSSNHQVLN